MVLLKIATAKTLMHKNRVQAVNRIEEQIKVRKDERATRQQGSRLTLRLTTVIVFRSTAFPSKALQVTHICFPISL